MQQTSSQNPLSYILYSLSKPGTHPEPHDLIWEVTQLGVLIKVIIKSEHRTVNKRRIKVWLEVKHDLLRCEGGRESKVWLRHESSGGKPPRNLRLSWESTCLFHIRLAPILAKGHIKNAARLLVLQLLVHKPEKILFLHLKRMPKRALSHILNFYMHPHIPYTCACVFTPFVWLKELLCLKSPSRGRVWNRLDKCGKH